MMAVDVELQQGALQAGAPRVLFASNTQPGAAVRNRYAVTPAGDRFVVVAPQTRDAIGPTTVVLNWDAGLPKGR
jgi:hypothetical protein